MATEETVCSMRAAKSNNASSGDADCGWHNERKYHARLNLINYPLSTLIQLCACTHQRSTPAVLLKSLQEA